MKRITALLSFLLAVDDIAFAQMSNDAAFQAGKSDGNALRRAAPTAIKSQDPNVIPGFGTPAVEANLFQKGRGVLGAPAAGKLDGCAPRGAARGQAPANAPTTPAGEQECDAINFVRGNAQTRPAFTIDPTTDPMIQGSLATIRNPTPVSGAYSACTTRPVTTPGSTTTETCQRATQLTPFTCERTLAVTVRERGSCIPGEWYARSLVGLRYQGDNGTRFTGIEVAARCVFSKSLDLVVRGATGNDAWGSAELAVDAKSGVPVSGAAVPLLYEGIGGADHHYGQWHTHARYEGGGCEGNACVFDFSAGILERVARCPVGTTGPNVGAEGELSCLDAQGTTVPAIVAEEYVPRYPGSFRFERAHLVYTFEDRWDDGCAPYTARLP